MLNYEIINYSFQKLNTDFTHFIYSYEKHKENHAVKNFRPDFVVLFNTILKISFYTK